MKAKSLTVRSLVIRSLVILGLVPNLQVGLLEQAHADDLSGQGGEQIAYNQGHRLTWQRDLNASLKLATQGNKYVLVDIYTDWCGWCKKLDRDTYTNADVVKYLNGQFVCLKLNAEDGGQGQAAAKKYGVKGYPCMEVLDGNGNLLGQIYGYKAPADFIAELSRIVGPAGQSH